MNTVNTSTKLSPFQLIGRSLRLIPPLTNREKRKDGETDAVKLMERMEMDLAKAKDNLMLAKIFQADQANRKWAPKDAYTGGKGWFTEPVNCE